MAHGAQAFIKSRIPEGFVGYACDVGACDGEFESNTIQLERDGWTVLCVEPNPLTRTFGTVARKLWRQVAAGDRNETRTFMAVGGFPYPSGSRIDADSGDKFQVEMMTLDRILEEAGFPRLDYLHVDVEGWEKEVMDGFTVERWKPRFITIEHYNHAHALTGMTKNIDKPLPISGYSPVATFQFDVMYERNNETSSDPLPNQG